MPDVNADVERLTSALGLGGFPYRSFRNPPVRAIPVSAPIPDAPLALPPGAPATPEATGPARAEPVLQAPSPSEPAPLPHAPARAAATLPARAPAPAFALLDRVVGQPIAVASPAPPAPRPREAAPADFPLLRKALGARGSN